MAGAGDKTKAKPIGGGKKDVPVYCYQCVAGPDLLKVEVESGVATRIRSNYSIAEQHPGGGRVCVKAYGLIQKTYNPNRIQQPMRRTNPKKGRAHDPGFVPISWDEAFDIIGEKLREIRATSLRDESGFPRLAASFGGGGTPTQYMGTFPAFLKAWGPADLGFGSGQGVKCYHSEHLYGELWHRAFVVSPDTPLCKYIIAFGSNGDASGGVAGIWRNADARARGLKRVQFEPHMSITGSVAAEWVPIKPKTDAACLYGLIHRILIERDWREVCDVPFLRDDTSSPYLVGSNGYFLRDPKSLKPMIFDRAEGRAKPYDEVFKDAALEGTYTVSGVEIGADEERWEHKDVACSTAFQHLLEFIRPYTPEWAAAECDVPVERIRRIADEYLENACVGATIDIEDETVPFRPVAVLVGKTVNSGWGGYHCVWARTVMLCLVGALEVPGGLLGTNVKISRPANDRQASANRMLDGFMEFSFNETDKKRWHRKPDIRNAYDMLVPLVGNSPWSAALGPTYLSWMFQRDQPDKMPKATKPDIWFCYRTNPAISQWNAPQIAEIVASFPFTVAFGYTLDETNHMADVILPDATDLESMQLMQIGATKFMEQFWRYEGWAIRQPAVEPQVDAKDMTEIATQLAIRAGILHEYNEAINSGAAGVRLRTNEYDYSIPVETVNDVNTIWDRSCKAASHKLSNGEDVHDLEWFREHGYMLKSYQQMKWYLYPHLKKNGIRFELPYQERILRHGRQLQARLHEAGIDWWEHQLMEYQPMPVYERFQDIWLDNIRKEFGKDPEEYPFWALTSRSMQYSWGANVGIPLIYEVADNIAGHRGVIINRTRAKELGIADGQRIRLESVVGQTEGIAVPRAGIRPDTVLMIGQFDHWKTPFAKDLGLASLNSVSHMSLPLMDSTGSGSDIARVKIIPLSGAIDA